MKQIFVTAILAIAALSTKAQTTVDEYNYLTKGYKTQIESGLDMKVGYSLKDLGEYSSKSRSCEFKALVKKANNKTVGTLAIFHAVSLVGTKKTYYFCIPTAGSDNSVMEMYTKSLTELSSEDANRDMAIFVSTLYSENKR
jgi:hypothetical protein